MSRSQLAYDNGRVERKWQDTLKEICEVARICLHNLVATNTPPLPRYYEHEFRQAASILGKTEVLDMVVNEADKQAYNMRSAILDANDSIEEAKIILEDFDREARRELGRMDRDLDVLDGQLKRLGKGEGVSEVMKSARHLTKCGHGFVDNLSEAIEKISRQQDLLNELAQKVHEDPLTGVLNRRAWERDLCGLTEAPRRQCADIFCIVIVDLDNFKEINDSYGHPVGDAALRQFAALLKEEFKEVGSVYRYGGDEFAILIRGLDIHTVYDKLVRLQERLASAVFIALGGRVRIRLTASFGLAQGSGEDDIHSVIAKADEMLYQAKKAGRNCIKCVAAGL